MSVVVCKKTRRQFLIGAGNTLLALPFLPSLFPINAMAQAAPNNRKMMVFWTDHATTSEYWPNSNIATTAVGNIGAREMLLRNLANTTTALSPVMAHPLWDTLRRSDMITMIRGLQVLGSGGHGYQPAGGNFEWDLGRIIQGPDTRPTFDSVLEASTSLYPANTPSYIKKAMRVTLQYGSPQYFSKTGNLMQTIPAYGTDDFDYSSQTRSSRGLRQMYNEVFSSLTGGTTPPADTTNLTKTNILNRVHASYTSFRNNRRISSDDRARVDQHLGMIADLQRRYVASQPPPTTTCNRPNAPLETISDPTVYTPIYMNLLALAFKCNLSKFGILYFDSHDPRWLPGLNLGGTADFHGGIHGDGGLTVKRNCYETYHTWNLNQIATHFLTHLNEQEGNTGRTYLENMGTVLLTQMGYEPLAAGGHTSYDMHQMIIGSMGGAIRSGRYVAYQPGGLSPGAFRPLMPLNSFLITLLHLMGVPESEYGRFNPDGRGFGLYTNIANHPYASRLYSPLTEILT